MVAWGWICGGRVRKLGIYAVKKGGKTNPKALYRDFRIFFRQNYSSN